MVTDANAVQSIAVDLGLLEALPAGALWALMSTIGVEATEAIASLVEPVSPPSGNGRCGSERSGPARG